jgi:phosphotransferase system HPr (HPr) family protein
LATSHEIIVQHKVGLHARPAALFVKTAVRFASEITLENVTRKSEPVNAKSILRVLAAGVKMNDQVRITATGNDEENAVTELVSLIQNNFGEAE